MKYATLVLLFLSSFFIANAQKYVIENFDDTTFPPLGWHIDNHPENWSYSRTRNALGMEVGEAVFTTKPIFMVDTTRLVSPVINTTNCNELILEFKENIVFAFGQQVYIGVQTRSNNGPWHTAWKKLITSNTGPEIISLTLDTEDVGAENFEFCIFYKGKSYNIRNAYFDDIKLLSLYEKDIEVFRIQTDKYWDAGDFVTPKITVINYGENAASFKLAYQCTDGQNNLIVQDTIIINDLQPLNFLEEEIAPFELPSTNEAYKITAKAIIDDDYDTTNNTLSHYVYTYDSPRENVLLEIGTGVTCGYCPGAAMGADDLIQNGHNVAVIEYHYYDHNNDPFSNDFAFVRTNYYNIFGYPTAFFDGTLSHIGGSANSSLYGVYLPLVEQRNEVKTAVYINFESITVKDDSIQVKVKMNKTAPIKDGTFVLQLALTESNIPYEWENQDELNFVERTMIPDAAGTTIDLINNETVTKTFTIPIDPDWVPENLELIAFIQNLYDMEVINTHKEMLLSVGQEEKLAGSQSVITVFPNPADDLVNIRFSTSKQKTDVHIFIYNPLGEKIEHLIRNNLSAGVHTIQWYPGNNLPKGIYFIKTVVNKQVYINRLIVK